MSCGFILMRFHILHTFTHLFQIVQTIEMKVVKLFTVNALCCLLMFRSNC